jgi:dipeptide/tripeptide permease
MKQTIVLGAAFVAAGVVVLAASAEHEPWSAQRFEIFGTLRSGRLAILHALHTLMQNLGVAR